MDEQPVSGSTKSNPRLVIGATIILLIMIVVLFLAISSQNSKATGLMPKLATPTLVNRGDSVPFAQVGFSELNADPISYLNHTIQVTGSFLPLARPACPSYSGPSNSWALISEELQLEAKGYERIVQILDPGTEMTIQGIWSLYQGPLGCGKGPARGSLWYLQVQKIIQPNPLIGSGSTSPIEIEFGDPGLPSLLPTASPTSTTEPTLGIVTETPTAIETLTPTPPETILPTVTSTPSPTSTFTFATATSTGTSESGSITTGPSLTPSLTSTVISGNPATNTPIPPQPATNTPSSGYPGPPSATPTATINPYP